MLKKQEDFVAKDRVHHSHFGPGTIVETNGRYTTIRFDGAGTGTRKFVTTLARLVRSDTPAPASHVHSRKKKK